MLLYTYMYSHDKQVVDGGKKVTFLHIRFLPGVTSNHHAHVNVAILNLCCLKHSLISGRSTEQDGSCKV